MAAGSTHWHVADAVSLVLPTAVILLSVSTRSDATVASSELLTPPTAVPSDATVDDCAAAVEVADARLAPSDITVELTVPSDVRRLAMLALALRAEAVMALWAFATTEASPDDA